MVKILSNVGRSMSEQFNPPPWIANHFVYNSILIILKQLPNYVHKFNLNTISSGIKCKTNKYLLYRFLTSGYFISNKMDILERIYRQICRQVNNFPTASTCDYINKSVNKVRVPPFTRDNVLFYYLPMQGLMSYTTLSVSVMNPHLMVRLFPKRDVTDLLFLTAGGGAGLWLWARPHMSAATPARRFSWAFLGGCLWPLGSIFLWAILRSSVGQKPVLGTIVGITTGAALTNIALDYFNYIELLFCGEIQQLPHNVQSPNSDDEKYDIDL